MQEKEDYHKRDAEVDELFDQLEMDLSDDEEEQVKPWSRGQFFWGLWSAVKISCPLPSLF